MKLGLGSPQLDHGDLELTPRQTRALEVEQGRENLHYIEKQVDQSLAKNNVLAKYPEEVRAPLKEALMKECYVNYGENPIITDVTAHYNPIRDEHTIGIRINRAFDADIETSPILEQYKLAHPQFDLEGTKAMLAKNAREIMQERTFNHDKGVMIEAINEANIRRSADVSTRLKEIESASFWDKLTGKVPDPIPRVSEQALSREEILKQVDPNIAERDSFQTMLTATVKHLEESRTSDVSAEAWEILKASLNTALAVEKEKETSPQLSMDRDRFITHLSTQYGLSEDAGATIYQTFEAIEEKFPEHSQTERDYLMNRLVGGFVYSGMSWDSTAGELGDFFSKQNHQEIFASLGIDKAEYDQLRYQVRIQNQISSGKLEEWNRLRDDKREDYLSAYNIANQSNLITSEFRNIWNEQRRNMIDKGDFAHQSITTATILYEMPNLTLAKIGVQGGEQKVKEMSGWLGDATIQTKDNGWFATKTVQFGADDYIADLDAANVTHLMKERSIDFLHSTDQYYNEYLAEGNSRATLFTEHTPYPYAEKSVVDEFGLFYTLEDLKKEQRDAYNFLMSIKNGEHEMKDYYK